MAIEEDWSSRRMDLRDLLDGRGVSVFCVDACVDSCATESAGGLSLSFRCELRVDRRVAVGDNDLAGETCREMAWCECEESDCNDSVLTASLTVDSRVDRRLSVLTDEGESS